MKQKCQSLLKCKFHMLPIKKSSSLASIVNFYCNKYEKYLIIAANNKYSRFTLPVICTEEASTLLS